MRDNGERVCFWKACHGIGILKGTDSGRMREEADYPPSFCVWDQDQKANPSLDEESRVKGDDGQLR